MPYNPDDPSSGPYQPNPNFTYTPGITPTEPQYNLPPTEPPPGVWAQQQQVNQAFQNYQPQNGVGGGIGWQPTGGYTNSIASLPPQQQQGPTGQGQVAPPAPQQPTGDWDMSQAGIGERVGEQAANQLMNQNTLGRQWATQNSGAFASPGSMEQYWEGVSGNYNNRPVATNRAESAYNTFQNQRNELGELPGLDPYYERARERASADINRQLAARGGFNSSRGMGVLSDAMQGLNAEQANREADYALQRSSNALNWASGGSQAASAADASSRGVAQTDLAQTLGYGSLANNAQNAEQNRLLTDLGVAMGLDTQEMSRLSGATQAAASSQMAREGRIGQMFDSQLGLGKAVSDTVGKSHDELFRMLDETEDAIHAATLTGDKAALDRATARRAEIQAGLGNAAEMGGKVLPLLG
jgi:hypothetical protein